MRSLFFRKEVTYFMTLLNKLTEIQGKYHKSVVKNVIFLLTGILCGEMTNLYKM